MTRGRAKNLGELCGTYLLLEVCRKCAYEVDCVCTYACLEVLTGVHKGHATDSEQPSLVQNSLI